MKKSSAFLSEFSVPSALRKRIKLKTICKFKIKCPTNIYRFAYKHLWVLQSTDSFRFRQSDKSFVTSRVLLVSCSTENWTQHRIIAVAVRQNKTRIKPRGMTFRHDLAPLDRGLTEAWPGSIHEEYELLYHTYYWVAVHIDLTAVNQLFATRDA